MTTTTLSHRDRAVLRAVAAGRCLVSGPQAGALTIDGLRCADQFVGIRLAGAGLIDRPAATGLVPARLTSTGRALLAA
jgi:hypothetical protein